MARNRFELEENRRKDALEAVINAAKAGAAYLEPAKATVQKNQSKKTAAKSTGSAKTAAAGGKSTRTAQTNPVRAAAVNANQAAARQVQQAATRKSTIPTFLQPKTTRIQPIIRPAMVNPVNALLGSQTPRGNAATQITPPITPLRTWTLPALPNTTATERMNDLNQLTANSVAWHFADDAQKQALFEANNAIRQKYSIGYLPGTGETYNRVGVNLSAPVAGEVQQIRDSSAIDRAANTLEASTKRVRSGLDNWFATGNLAPADEAEQRFLSGENIGLLDKIRLKNRWGNNWEDYLTEVREAFANGDAATIQDYENRVSQIRSLYDTTPLINEAANQAEQAKLGVGKIGQTALDVLGMGADMAGYASLASTGGGGGGLFTGMSSLSAAGQAADQARRMGATSSQQEGYGNAVGLVNYAVERLGGIGGGTAASKVADRILPQAAKDAAGRVTGNAASRILAGGLEEGLEGAIQSEAERGLRNAMLGANEAFSGKEFARDIGYNALFGSIFRGGQEAALAVGSRRKNTAWANEPVRPQIQAGTQAAIRPNIESNNTASQTSYLSAADLPDYLNTGKKQSTRNAKARMVESGDSPILTNRSQVADLVQRAAGGERGTIKAFGKVDPRLADAVRNASDGAINIDGRYLEIGTDDIAHSIEQHMQPKQAGDIPLTFEDYVNIPDYIADFDDILQVRPGKNAVIFQIGKKINGHSIITEIVSNERNSVRVRNMWGVSTDKYNSIYKNNRTASNRVPEPYSADQINPSADSSVGTYSIPQTNGNSNTPAAQNGPIRPIIQPAPADASAAPVRAGRATTIQSPYTGKMPQNAGTEAQTRPLQIGKADVEGAQQAIFASQQGGTFARTVKSVLQNIFQQNGGARTVTVQGVTFDGKPYDVVLNPNVASKVASDPNMSVEKMSVFSRLDELVASAEYVGSSNYGKVRNKAPNVVRYDYFEKPILIDGTPFIATFDVEVYHDRNNFRTYKVINEIDLQPVRNAMHRSTTGSGVPTTTSLSDNSISQTNGNSNTPVAQNDPIRPIIQPAQGVSPDSSVGAAQRIQPVISTFGENTVGAAQSGFTPKQNVSKVYSNTFQNSGIFNNAEQELLHIRDQDGDALYDVVSEKQSIQNAKDRLDIDFEGELTDLPNKPNFSGEDNDTAMGIIHQLRNEARESGDFSEVAKWVKMVKEKGTEGGQFIQSFAKYTRTPEGAMVQGQREIDAALKLWEKTNPKRIKKLQEQGYLIWTEADMQKVADYMEQAHDAGLDTYDGKMYEAKAMHVIAERIPSTAKDKVVSLLMDNMLGNFRTLVARNAGGNALFSIPEGVREQLVAAPLDALTSAITKQRTTYFSPIKKTGQWMKGFGKGSKEMAGDIRHGVHTARSGEDASIRAQQRTFRNKGLGRVGNAYDALVGTALEVGDRPFYEAAYAAKMQDLETARRKGQLTKDFDGKDFDSYAPQVARQAALEAVFQNNGLVAQGMTNVANAIGQISRGVTGTSALRQSALPFTKTPGNLAERAIEYSPLGALKNSIGTFNEVRRGTFNQQRFVNETSRNIVGTLIFLAANGLVESDIVTGALSDDRDEKEAQKNAGMQEYAVKIGDNYYSYSWIPVVGPALAGAADFYQALNSMDKNTLAAAWDAAGGYVQSAVFEQSALSGLEEMFSGYGSTVDNIGSTLASVSSQLVPSIVRQIAAATDPYERQTYVSGDTLQSQLNYLKSSIPGLRQTLPIKRDEQGNEKLASQGRGLGARIAENMFLPAKVTADQSNAVRDELMRLKQATGLTTQFQTKVTYAVENNGEKKLLTPFQSMEYQKYYGQTSTQAIQELMNSGAYSTLSDSEKVKVISEINSYAKAFADSQFIDKEFDTSQQKAQEAQNMGIGIGNYYAFTNGARKIQEANKGAADSTEKNVAGIVDLLESAGFRDMSESQKDYLFDSAGYSAMLNPYHISEIEAAAENNPYYQKLDGENKYYFRSLANEYEDAVDNGKALDGWIAKAKLAADNGVVEPYQFVALKLALLYADTDQNGSYKQSEVTAAINKLSGLTRQQKAYLWQAQNKSWKRNPFGYASVYWPETEKQDNSPSAVISRRTGGMGGTK